MAVEVTVGVSFTLLTVIVKLWVSTALLLSVAVSTTECVPTSEFVGVPERTPVPALKLSHDGRVVAAYVTVSPLSTSLAASV